jgi:hypothetical protein
MNTVAAVKGQLDQQKESNAVEAKRREEEEQKKVEEERSRLEEEQKAKELVDAAAARERLAMTQKLAEDELAVMLTERELRAKRLALSDTQKAAGNVDNNNDDDEGSESAPEGPKVCLDWHLITAFITYYNM